MSNEQSERNKSIINFCLFLFCRLTVDDTITDGEKSIEKQKRNEYTQTKHSFWIWREWVLTN